MYAEVAVPRRFTQWTEVSTDDEDDEEELEPEDEDEDNLPQDNRTYSQIASSINWLPYNDTGFSDSEFGRRASERYIQLRQLGVSHEAAIANAVVYAAGSFNPITERRRRSLEEQFLEVASELQHISPEVSVWEGPPASSYDTEGQAD